jgi:hypothetical protein
LAVVLAAIMVEPADGQGGSLVTRWAEAARGEAAAYPRPTMRRERWISLDGMWGHAVTAGDAPAPARDDGRIRVPFPIESRLSGVGRALAPDERLWYRRTFVVPDAWRAEGRVLLHFEAVDWEAEVLVDGTSLGVHRGGYDRFTLDITDALAEAGPHELVVAVRDPTDTGEQPRGKQTLRPRGIWYTAVSGIWQSVWLEPVPETSIRGLRTTTDASGAVTVLAKVNGAAPDDEVEMEVGFSGSVVARQRGPVGRRLGTRVDRPYLWSPESPVLYDLTVRVLRDGAVVDEVQGYLGIRTIALGRGEHGAVLVLNGKPLFQIGPLDQGWWPDGLYTAPTDEALRFDVEVMKRMGFNMVRKHVKIEPERWYTFCDQFGLLVWQDMPSGGPYAPFVTDPTAPGHTREVRRGPAARAQFETELAALIEQRFNHPSIVMWVPFNEGWGQYDTHRIADLVKRLDPTRLVNPASGWNDLGGGDVLDIHRYPGPGMPEPEPHRAIVLGEFGGLGLPLPGHLWTDEGNWGYRSYADRDALALAYESLSLRLHTLVGEGLSAAVYTQLTDVELEVNGLLTYDRAEIKIDPDRLRAIHRRLAGPPPRLEAIVPASDRAPQTWRYTLEPPGAAWEAVGYDDRAWLEGEGGFGAEGTPGARIGTPWETAEIWIRRTVRLDEVPAEPWLLIHHDEDAEVYINGRLVKALTGYTTDYALVRLDADGAAALRPGENVIAVHCRQTGGGQYIDAGLVRVIWPAASR